MKSRKRARARGLHRIGGWVCGSSSQESGRIHAGNSRLRAASWVRIALFMRGAEVLRPDHVRSCRPVCRLALGAPAHGQGAQANWWESLTGSGTPDYTGRRQEDRARDRAAQQNEVLDDLRPDAMPMRSDEMVAAMDAAIAKYQQIADNGGWPIIPPGRMMREGEDDERVPLLRRRLQMSGDLRLRSRRLQLLHVRQRSHRRGEALPAPQRPASDGTRRALDLSGAQHDGRRAHRPAAHEPRPHPRADGDARRGALRARQRSGFPARGGRRNTRCSSVTASSSAARSGRRRR